MISVVIPTRNDQSTLGPCLGALTPGLMAGILREVILADSGSTDDTAAIAEAVGARLVPGGLAAGAAAARGPWLMLLPPTTVLGDDWAVAAQAHLTRHPNRAGWFGLRFAAAGPVPALRATGIGLRAMLFARPVAAQGLLLPLALWRRLDARSHAEAVRRLGRRGLRGLGSRAVSA